MRRDHKGRQYGFGPNRGNHRGRQWGGWGGMGNAGDNDGGGSGWNGLGGAACIANCQSSHVCTPGDNACLCSGSDNQRVLDCLTESCAEGSAATFQAGVQADCGSAGFAVSTSVQSATPLTPSTPSATPTATVTRAPSPPASAEAATASTPTAILPPVVLASGSRTPLADPEGSSSSFTSSAPSASPSSPSSPSSSSSTIPTSPWSSTSAFASSSTLPAAHGTYLANEKGSSSTDVSEGGTSTSASTLTSTSTHQQSYATPETTRSISRPFSSVLPPSSAVTDHTEAQPPTTLSDGLTLPSLSSLSSGGTERIAPDGVAGIVIALLLILALLASLFVVLKRRRKRERGGITSRPISPPTLSGGNAAHTTSWIDFGGGRLSSDNYSNEKETPIYAKFSGSKNSNVYSAFSGPHTSYSNLIPAHPPSATLSGAQALPRDIRRSRLLSFAGSRKSGRKSRLAPKWIDFRAPDQPSHSASMHTPSVIPARSVYRSGSTSYFSRLLSHDRPPPVRKPSRVVTKHTSKDALLRDLTLGASRHVAQEEEELSGQQPGHSDRSLSPSHPGVRASRPSIASSRLSVPHDVFSEDTDVEEAKATSTRAPSVDLAWVTQNSLGSPTQPLAHSPSMRKRSIRRKASSTGSRPKSRKSAPTPTFTSPHTSSTPSTPGNNTGQNEDHSLPPIPEAARAVSHSAYMYDGSESPALPSSNNSATASRPTSSKTVPTPTTATSTRVGRAI